MKKHIPYILIIAALVMMSGTLAYQIVHTDGTLHGDGTYTDPIRIDTSGTSKFLTKYGAGVELESRDKYWFGTNEVSNGDHTHDARYHISTVNHIGGWEMNCGVSGQTTFQFDSTGFGVVSPQITFLGTGDDPRIWVDGALKKIYFNATNGVFFENLASVTTLDSVLYWRPATGQMYAAPAKAYHEYVSILNQSGTTAPVPTELFNDLGEVEWAYLAPGVYNATSEELFTSGYTVVICDKIVSDNHVDNQLYYSTAITGESTIELYSGTLATRQDDRMNDYLFTIRVYD